jgi:hypothetical protein
MKRFVAASSGTQPSDARIYGPDEVHRMVVARRILQSFTQGDAYSFE